MKRTGLSPVSIRYGVLGFSGDPGLGDPPPSPDDAIARAKFEADTARAEAARIKRELDEIKKGLPTDEQRARWAELEAAHLAADEANKRKAGEWDALRQQMADRHAKEIEAERSLRENASAQSRQLDKELCDTLVGLEFRGATALFGPAAKTVMLPEVAQAYFAHHVEVETVAGVNGGPAKRRVVVKDKHGQIIVDSKTGQPMPFAKAMEEVIDAHPQREHLLRGSGKVGANSSGGGGGPLDGLDITKLRPDQFQDPKVREALREQQSKAGGLQVGPAFDRMRARK